MKIFENKKDENEWKWMKMNENVMIESFEFAAQKQKEACIKFVYKGDWNRG